MVLRINHEKVTVADRTSFESGFLAAYLDCWKDRDVDGQKPSMPIMVETAKAAARNFINDHSVQV
jgi:hypothetical protein